MTYLHEHVPAWTQPRISLTHVPTPLQEAPTLAADLGVGRLFIKRDDQTAQPYGGNKVRKLEWLLADAQRQGARTVITFGAAGSNHALATAIYARRLGMHPMAMLVPQPAEPVVRANLLRHLGEGTELHYFENKMELKEGLRAAMARSEARDGAAPYVIPAGGSAPLGMLGYVNAALELTAQCRAMNMPMPDRLYTACGTMGTAVGLALGLALAGAPTCVEAVRVTEEEHANRDRGRALFDETARLLLARETDMPMPRFPEDTFTLRHDFFGDGYGIHTRADEEAAGYFEAHAGAALECTYTAKAFRALMADAERGHLRGETVVFWDTYSAHAPAVEGADFHRLPEVLWSYFRP